MRQPILIDAAPVSQQPRGGYGLWSARVKGADGRTYTGGGLCREAAIRNAFVKAAGAAAVQRKEQNPAA